MMTCSVHQPQIRKRFFIVARRTDEEVALALFKNTRVVSDLFLDKGVFVEYLFFEFLRVAHVGEREDVPDLPFVFTAVMVSLHKF